VFTQLSLLQYKVAAGECQISHEMTSDIKKHDDLHSSAEAISQEFSTSSATHYLKRQKKCALSETFIDKTAKRMIARL